MLCALLAVSNPGVRAVVEDHAVDETLHDRASFMLLRSYEAVHRRRHIDIQRAGKECTSGAEH